MSCEQYRDALTDVAAGGPVPAGLEEHLAACEACREELAALRRALAVAEAEMARLVGAEPSPGLTARIRQSVAKSDSAPAWRFGWVWPAMAASVALLVAFAVWTARVPAPARVAVGAVAGHSRSSPGARPGPGDEGSAVPPAGGTSVPGSATLAPRSSGPTVRPEARRAGGSLGTRRVGSPRDDRPVVLVPQGEAEALVRFAAIVCRDRHAPGALATVGRPSTDLAEPPALVITPLEIVPLDAAETPGT